jgi:acetylornithine deacetylase/succinyl-diaminopimelate desuccinylase-like protein
MPLPVPVSPVIELCRELVRIPSLSGQEGDLGQFVADWMGAAGFAVARDAHGSVLGTRQGFAPGPALLLDAHLDTVPVGDPVAWTHDPFAGELAEGRLWGRGSADTKGSLAAMLCAAAAQPGAGFRGTLMVSASVCEENLTAAALAQVLQRHPADLVLVGEPTSLRLGTAQKGRAGLVLEARGRSAHSSRPELGENAVYKLLEAVARVRALPLPVDPELGRGVCELIEMTSEPKGSIGMVPDRCTARLALRLLPGETEASVLARITGCLAGLDGITVTCAQLTQVCSTGLPLAMREFIPAWRNPHADLESRLLAALGTTAFAAPFTTNASAAAARGFDRFIVV